MPYGAFCILPEYNDLEAFLHVSEVAPRWIKNIHEFISEGQRYVVKVHHVDTTKNQVDVSIKRVSDEEKKQKLELIQNEKRGEKLLEVSLRESGVKLEVLEVRKKLETEFGDVFSCFREASEKGEKALDPLDLPAKLKSTILDVAKKNIKKPVVTITSIVNLTCYSATGVETIQKALAFKDAKEDIAVHYLGAPRYKVTITAADYKSAEKRMGAVMDGLEKFAAKHDCDFTFEREKA